MKRRTLLCAVLCLPALLLAQEKVDLSVVNRIKAEAFQNSKIMDHAFYLSDVYGPRLANSPGFFKAAEWAVKTLKGWGLEDARLEKWGPYGRAWSCSRFVLHMLEPQPAPLVGVPLAWSPGTDGAVSGEVVLAPIKTPEEGEKYKGKLKGKFVMTDAPRELAPHFEPDARRQSDTDLDKLALAPDPAQPPARRVGPRMEEARQARIKLAQFFKSEGVLAVISEGSSGDDGTLPAAAAGSPDPKDPLPPTSLVLAAEHYNRIARLIDKNIPVRLELEMKVQLGADSIDGANVVANLPGGSKKDQIVMIGAHLDSWQAGTGATDNAAGSAVMLEVVRILTALDLKMDRTVRVALWDAEEQGIVGSREYVKVHFADRDTMALQPEHAKLSGYFNLDNGTGKIRGVYLQGNDMMRPIFEAWLGPFKDLGAATIAIRNTGSTDHVSFDDVGLPGFQFIQDPLDYGSRTHHTNMDTYDHLQKADLMQASAILASLVYDAATRPDMLPRKPLPKPQPPAEAKKPEPKKD
jgi:hypothetical protein